MKRVCPVHGCGKTISKLEVGRHFRTEHPEYKWTREIRHGTSTAHYYCLMPDRRLWQLSGQGMSQSNAMFAVDLSFPSERICVAIVESAIASRYNYPIILF